MEETRRTGLVVDDDPTVRVLAAATLSGLGLRAIECDSGESALAAFASEPTDLVLLDIELPGRDGFSTCQELRQLPGGRDVPILMLTGHGDLPSVEDGFAAGATDFMMKPVNGLILKQRIAYLLRASEAFASLRKREESLRLAQRIARLGNWSLDPTTWCLRGSEEFRRIFGLADSAEWSFDVFLSRLVPADRANFRRALEPALSEGRDFGITLGVANAGQPDRVIRVEARPGKTDDGTLPVVEGVAQDVTAQRLAEDRIQFLAHHDSLTDLGNRTMFRDRLIGALEVARRYGRVFALLVVDLDNFKRVNEQIGHARGDDVLREVARRLTESVRSSDSVTREPAATSSDISRIGGDQFTVLLREMSFAEDAGRVAHRILEQLSMPLEMGGGQAVQLSASLGVATFPADGEDDDSLVRNADAAMCHAKESGGGRYSFYNRSMNAEALERFQLEASLRQTLAEGGLDVHYQPRLDLKSRTICAAEALARWNHPELGAISPGVFIPLAEQAGLISQLGEWVLRRACRDARRWHDQGLGPLSVSVNLSAMQLGDPTLEASIADCLAESGLAPEHLEVEITETALVENEELAAATLQSIKRLGVRVALDDFGTGYSSMVYVRRFPVDIVKVDRCFVGGIDRDPEDARIVKAIIAMARALGLRIVAEGVETEPQHEFLVAHECDEEQGFRFSRPLSIPALEQLLARHFA